MKSEETIKHKIKQLEKFKSEIDNPIMIKKWQVVLNYLNWVLDDDTHKD